MMYYQFDHVRLAPEKQIGLHTQPGFEISYIITGKGIRILGTVTEPFEEGEVILVPPGLPHQWQFSPDSVDAGGCIENITFHFSQTFLDRVVNAFPELSSDIMRLKELSEAVSFKGKMRETLIDTLMNIDRQDGKGRIPGMLSLVMQMSGLREAQAISSLSAVGSPQKRLEKIRVYVSCNYARNITIDEIASYTGMNRTSFCAFFKRHVGKTFTQALNDYRIERACELLSMGDANVSEVAALCGFRDAAYFIKTFKKALGVTPANWKMNTATISRVRPGWTAGGLSLPPLHVDSDEL